MLTNSQTENIQKGMIPKECELRGIILRINGVNNSRPQTAVA